MHRTRKALAYITQGNKLLLFTHPQSPEAGIQIPGGTIQIDETPQEAVIREAREETGLEHLRLEGLLCEQIMDLTPYGRDETQHRYFFHLVAEGVVPDEWQHGEAFASTGEGYIPFEFYWVELPDNVPQLIADMDYCLDALIEKLKQDETL